MMGRLFFWPFLEILLRKSLAVSVGNPPWFCQLCGCSWLLAGEKSRPDSRRRSFGSFSWPHSSFLSFLLAPASLTGASTRRTLSGIMELDYLRDPRTTEPPIGKGCKRAKLGLHLFEVSCTQNSTVPWWDSGTQSQSLFLGLEISCGLPGGLWVCLGPVTPFLLSVFPSELRMSNSPLSQCITLKAYNLSDFTGGKVKEEMNWDFWSYLGGMNVFCV